MAADDGIFNDRANTEARQQFQPRVIFSRTDGQAKLPMEQSAEARAARSIRQLWLASAAATEQTIPTRNWVRPPIFMRGAVTCLAGAGSAGKSTLVLAWAVALALGVQYGMLPAGEPRKVLVYSIEDDHDEMERRLAATMRQFGVSASAVNNLVIRCGPRGLGTLISCNRITGQFETTETWDALEYEIERHKPDVVILDPLVELHESEEADNTALRAIIARFRATAVQHGIAIGLVHHTRKGAIPGDADSIRGASAIVAACRAVLTVFLMSEEEATQMGVPISDRRQYFRLDNVKANYSRSDDPAWHQLVEYELDNGDLVAAAVPWKPPSVWKGTAPLALNEVLDAIDEGPGEGVRYTRTRRRGTEWWAGRPLVEQLGIGEDRAADMLKQWFGSGLLFEQEYYHMAQRKKRLGVHVNHTRRPTI